MNIKKYITPHNYKNFLRYHLKNKFKKSYAQCGEDIIIENFLSGIGISKPTYIDIGTYHPILNNNTYLFYKKGGHGICIEPDDVFFRLIRKNRKNDVCLNVGVGPTENPSAKFYKMSSHNLNTFSKSGAEQTASGTHYGKQQIKNVVNIPLVTVSGIIKKYLNNKAPDFLSIDAEGLDLEILNSIDFNIYRPKVIATETLRYNSKGVLEKETEAKEFLENKGYFLYADTYVNSIFVDKKLIK